jgi:hypothetical protein
MSFAGPVARGFDGLLDGEDTRKFFRPTSISAGAFSPLGISPILRSRMATLCMYSRVSGNGKRCRHNSARKGSRSATAAALTIPFSTSAMLTAAPGKSRAPTLQAATDQRARLRAARVIVLPSCCASRHTIREPNPSLASCGQRCADQSRLDAHARVRAPGSVLTPSLLAPVLFGLPLHRRRIGVLHFEPIGRASRTGGP